MNNATDKIHLKRVCYISNRFTLSLWVINLFSDNQISQIYSAIVDDGSY